MRSIGQIMDENNGIGPGYDALRVGLAFSVIFRHCFPISYGESEAASSGFFWTATMGIVPIFFILSGFLVTGSALRLSIGKFVASRVLRIVPALVVDTMVTVLIIGAIFTTLPLVTYAASPVTHAYFLNILGVIHYALPGVFSANPVAGVVNGALWTIPPELGCYIFICGLIIIGWVSEWKRTLAIALLTLVAIAAAPYYPAGTPSFILRLANHPGALLVPEFLIGSVLFLKRHSIPYYAPAFWVCVALILTSGFFLPETTFSVMPIASALAIPVYGYVAIFIGATHIPKLPIFSRGDYSYGIYLYGFPIQQGIVAATGIVNPFALFALTIVPVTLLAMFSWHCVEKPTLRLRKGFSMASRIEAKRKAAEAAVKSK